MNLLSRFYILKTASSEVNKKTLFKHRFTTRIPDLFFAFCFASSFFAAQSFDKIFTVLIFFFGHSIVGASVFATFSITPFVWLFWFEKNHGDCIPGYKIRNFCSAVLIFVGFGPFLICGSALKNSFENQNLNIPLKCHSVPVFYLKHNDICLMKIYYIFNVALKSIPQFYIVSILILKGYITGVLAILGQVSLIVNMVMFSLTMAMTFPLRSTPRVYTTSFCILLNAFCKFMATLCGCVSANDIFMSFFDTAVPAMYLLLINEILEGINLAIFAMLFSKLGYYALLVHAIKSLVWIWPSWWVLKTQPHKVTPFYFGLFLFFLTLIFSFIYIHPLEGKGKLIYYFFYLMKFCSEIFCIYVLADANSERVFMYLTLLIVMLGYLSCYGLLNILHKYKCSKYGCELDLEIEKKNEGK